MIGAGGLGCPALLALLDAGVRRLGLLEPDRVELSNLHRQLLYTEADVGRPKAEVAAEVLRQRAPGVELEVSDQAFSAETRDWLPRFDLVLDGTDRFETKLAVSDACTDADVPYVFAGVVGYEGQVLGVRPGRSACLRCLFDEAPPPGAAPTCAELGILGPIAGLVAARQVEVGLGLLAGDPAASDRLWVYDGRRDRAREVPLARAADCRGCGARRHLRGALEPEMTAPSQVVAPLLDLEGLACPETFIRTRRRLEELPPGGRLWVHLSSDESARSVPISARAAGHRVLAALSDGRRHRVLLERAKEGET